MRSALLLAILCSPAAASAAREGVHRRPQWRTPLRLVPAVHAAAAHEEPSDRRPESVRRALRLQGGFLRRRKPPRPPQPPATRPERSLIAVGFAFSLAVGFVSLTPAPALIERVGSESATTVLAYVAAISAVCEIVVTPILGALSDTLGRKPVLLGTLALVSLVHMLTVVAPTVGLIALSKFVCSLVLGLFFMTTSAILADAYRDFPSMLASATGLLTAVIFGGTSIGVLLTSKLGGVRGSYTASVVAAIISLAFATLFVQESVSPNQRMKFMAMSLNPLAGLRLLRMGRRLRLLTILFGLSLEPLFMGDVLQVYMIDQWMLDRAAMRDIVSLRQIAGMLANTFSGRLIDLMGVRAFASVAIVSELLYWVGFSHSRSATLVCAVVGFLGPARSLSANTMLTAEGARMGIPQGLLSGYRGSFVAILKVVGPLVHGKLYVLGKKWGVPQLPMLLNVGFLVVAFIVAIFALRTEPSDIREPHSGRDSS